MSACFAAPQSPTIATLQFPEWQREYQAALFELDVTKLPQRMRVAESVLLERLRVITHTGTLGKNERRLKTRSQSSVYSRI